MELNISVRDPTAASPLRYASQAERRLAIALGILGAAGFLVAGLIWWQLLY